MAANQMKWDCVELLLSYHASPIAMRNDCRSLLDIASENQAPPHVIQLIQAAIFDHERPRLLHHARYINDARHGLANAPALREGFPRVELSPPPPPSAGNNEDNEQGVLHAVLRFTLGMKEDGSVCGGMMAEHLVELWDMMLPVWDAEREGEGTRTERYSFLF